MEVAAFHPLPVERKRLVSVALFLAFAETARLRLVRPGVTRHPALWSPDFPLPRNDSRQRRSGRLRTPIIRGLAATDQGARCDRLRSSLRLTERLAATD